MRRISLDGTWNLRYFPQGEIPVDRPGDLDTRETDSVEATVPGNVELDLQRAGIIGDPFVGTSIYGLVRFESYEWWYDRSFATPDDREGNDIILKFHGIDCLSEIWLNGRRIGGTDNMLVPWSFDVTDALSDSGPNTLAIRIRSAVLEARSYTLEPAHAAMATNYEQLFIRKAPHMYGWDIAPRAVSAGLWRGVDLEIHERTEITVTHYATLSVGDGEAVVRAGWQFRTESRDLNGFSIRLRGHCADSSFDETFEPLFTAGERMIRVPDARLWWPKGYGRPDLYEVTWELIHDGTTVDTRHDTIGLRTVELERSDTAGEDGEFRFVMNGVPVFCRGSNWVPLDAFHSRDAGRYESVLKLFDDLGCNIIRCWGGNVYEDVEFFSYCDRHGIMVWQDFSFACAIYPQDDQFLRRVRREAEFVVRTLRNHPSIVLWAGDNEIDVIYVARGLDPANNLISRRILSEVCAECDPYRPYLPSSPYVSPEAGSTKRAHDQSSMPEQHLWGPRDYFKGSFYAENTAHFASEIGYHGCPNVSSIERFIEKEYRWPWADNDQWRAHATDPVPGGGPFAYRIKLMADQIREMFGTAPDNLCDFARASQISQAEAKKFFIEMFRIPKWRKTGIIWWNVIDCWPQFSDAVVDYYYARKLAYWYIRRAQTPVCVMIDEPQNWHCRVVATNDTLEPVSARLRITDAETDEEVYRGDFSVGANDVREVGRIRVSHGEHRVFLIRWDLDGMEYGNHYLLGKPPFDLDWYARLLERIASLPQPFDVEQIAR